MLYRVGSTRNGKMPQIDGWTVVCRDAPIVPWSTLRSPSKKWPRGHFLDKNI